MATAVNIGPLTTEFIPDPWCTTGMVSISVVESATQPFESVDTTTMTAILKYDFSSGLECSISGSNSATSITNRCVPTSLSPGFASVQYYSPGLYCPSGWTTALTAWSGSSLDTTSPFTSYLDTLSLEPQETVVYCCPSDLSLQATGVVGSLTTAYCQSVVPTGFVFQAYDWDNDCSLTVSTLASGTILASAIRFQHQSSDLPPGYLESLSTSSDGATSTPSGQNTAGHPSSTGLSTGARVGIGIGCGIAGLLILGCVAFFILRHRRANKALSNDHQNFVTEKDLRDKPELHGYSAGHSQGVKPELDGERAALSELHGRGPSNEPQELEAPGRI